MYSMTHMTGKLRGISVALAVVLAACSGAANQPKNTLQDKPAAQNAPAPASENAVKSAPAIDSPLASPIGRDAPAPLESPVNDAAAVGEFTTGDAMIDSVLLKASDAAAPKLSAVIKGMLGDSCTTLGDVVQKRDGKLLVVAVKTKRPKGKMCAQVVSEFESTVALDTRGLEQGDHQVVVNGVIAPFKIGANGAFEIPAR